VASPVKVEGFKEWVRNLQLELTAFAPFIEPLDRDQQDFERVIMTRKNLRADTRAA
jgi:hypothetical protein